MSRPSFGELDGRDPYDILELPPDASEAEVRLARKRLLRKYHPDMPSGDLRRTQMITAAADLLLDPLRKLGYYDLRDEDRRTAFTTADRDGVWFGDQPATADADARRETRVRAAEFRAADATGTGRPAAGFRPGGASGTTGPAPQPWPGAPEYRFRPLARGDGRTPRAGTGFRADTNGAPGGWTATGTPPTAAAAPTAGTPTAGTPTAGTPTAGTPTAAAAAGGAVPGAGSAAAGYADAAPSTGAGHQERGTRTVPIRPTFLTPNGAAAGDPGGFTAAHPTSARPTAAQTAPAHRTAAHPNAAHPTAAQRSVPRQSSAADLDAPTGPMRTRYRGAGHRAVPDPLAASRWNALAIASVLSIVTWTPLPLILGLLSLSQIRRFHQRGTRLAVTGIVAGVVLLVVDTYALVISGL